MRNRSQVLYWAQKFSLRGHPKNQVVFHSQPPSPWGPTPLTRRDSMTWCFWEPQYFLIPPCRSSTFSVCRYPSVCHHLHSQHLSWHFHVSMCPDSAGQFSSTIPFTLCSNPFLLWSITVIMIQTGSTEAWSGWTTCPKFTELEMWGKIPAFLGAELQNSQSSGLRF